MHSRNTRIADNVESATVGDWSGSWSRRLGGTLNLAWARLTSVTAVSIGVTAEAVHRTASALGPANTSSSFIVTSTGSVGGRHTGRISVDTSGSGSSQDRLASASAGSSGSSRGAGAARLAFVGWKTVCRGISAPAISN
jgi:hypothetical protein